MQYEKKISVGNEKDAVESLYDAFLTAKHYTSSLIELSSETYNFHPESTHKKIFYITNSQAEYEKAGYEKSIGCLLENIENLTIDGQGATIYCLGKMTFFAAFNCRNITLKNITVDYVNPTVTEIAVIEKGKNYLICRVHPDSKYRIQDGKILWYGQNFEFSSGISQIYDPTTNTTWRHYGPLEDKDATWEEIAPNIIKLSFSRENPYGIEVGQEFQMRDAIRDECGIVFSECENVSLENVTMRYMHGLGIVAQNSNNLKYNKVYCAPDDRSGRHVSCFADCMQFSGCRGKIMVEDSVFCGAHDDAINVHGTYLKIIEAKGRKLLLKFMHPQTFGITVFNKGDYLEAFDADSLLPVSRGRVSKVLESDSPYFISVELTEESQAFKIGDVVENISACPDFIVRNCNFSRIPTRGILATTRGKVIIENNLFYGIRYASVLIANDAASWYESGRVCDVLISGNVFENCNSPIVKVFPENKKILKNEFVHGNITLRGNRVIGDSVNWIYAKSVKNLLLSGNVSEGPPLEPVIIHCGKVIIN